MATHDPRPVAELALESHLSPALPEQVLAHLCSSHAIEHASLVRGDEEVARWGEGPWQPVVEVPLLHDRDEWRLRLAVEATPDPSLLVAARLALRAWELQQELKRIRFDERLRTWELESVRAIASSVAGTLEPEQLAEDLLSHLVALLGVRRGQLFLGEAPSTAILGARFGAAIVRSDELAEVWRGSTADDRLAVPISSRRSQLGLVVVADKEARSGTAPFSPTDRHLVGLIAVQAAVALEFSRLYREALEKQRIERELELAAAIQGHLFPDRLPSAAGWETAARSVASRQVGGDSYDLLAEDGALLAAIVDVSGKGVSAGMLASSLHAGIRLLSARESLAETAADLGAYLYGASPENRYATAMLVRFGEDGSFRAVNAGHCPGLLLRADGSVEEVGSTGMPIGLIPGSEYGEHRGRLDTGDVLALYSDGLSEAESPDGEQLGVEGLREILRPLRTGPLETSVARTFAALDDYTGGRAPGDDCTLVLIRRG